VAKLIGMVFYLIPLYVFMVYALDQTNSALKYNAAFQYFKLSLIPNEEWLKLERKCNCRKEMILDRLGMMFVSSRVKTF
jgi:hypothetical protein